jgi:serine/threonine protein kinase
MAFTKCGTPGFIAPEIFLIRKKESHYGKDCDYFSLGITFYFIRFGRIPYNAGSKEELIEKNRMLDFSYVENENFINSNSKGNKCLSMRN